MVYANQPSLSADVFNSVEFVFGDMLDLTMSPSTHTTSTICRRLLGCIIPNVDADLHTFASPSRTKKQLYLDFSIHRALLTGVCQAVGNLGGSELYYGYINILQYHAYLGALVLQ